MSDSPYESVLNSDYSDLGNLQDSFCLKRRICSVNLRVKEVKKVRIYIGFEN